MDSIIQRKIRKLFHHPIDFIRDLKILRKYTWKKAPIPVQAKSENVKNINKETKKDKVPVPPKVVVPPKAAAQDDFFREIQIGVDLIHKFSSNYPVNSLRWKGKILLWPAIRFYLTLVSVIYSRGGLKNGRVFQPFPNIYWRRLYIKDSQAYDVEDYIPKEKYDFLVFSGNKSISWVEENGKIYDRLLDPLIESLERYGKTKKILVVNSSGKLEHKFNFQPDFLLFPIQYKVNNAYAVDEFDYFASCIVKHFKKYNLTASDIGYFIDIFLYQYFNYIDLLKKIQPKAIFFFPIDYNASLIMAAHTLGIHTVDVQHGNMIGYYLQYNKWDEQPKDGYSLFPDTVLTWSKREKEHIYKNFNNVDAIVFGYPWLDIVESTKYIQNKRLEKFCSHFKYIIIVSLSEHKFIPKIIEDIANDYRSEEMNIGFIFKRNPKRVNTVIPKLKNMYTDDNVTYSSFLSLTKYANLHITESSSCLYEADYLGLNTIVIGDNWKLHFKDLVESERIFLINSVDEFYNIFEKAVSFCHFPRLIDNKSNEFDDFMKKIVTRS